MKRVLGISVALLVALGAGWVWGASGRSDLSRALLVAELRGGLLEGRAAVLDARLAVYSVNFGEASRHLEAARSALRAAEARLNSLGRQAEAKPLELALAKIDEAQRMAGLLNQDANALAADASKAIDEDTRDHREALTCGVARPLAVSRVSMTETPEQDPRIYFAAERTFLAWLRTGLALMGFGFVVARFGLFLREIAVTTGTQIPTAGSSRWFGIGLLVLGVLVTAVACAEHIATVRRLKRGEPFVGRPTWLGGVLAALLVAVGILMTAYLLVSL